MPNKKGKRYTDEQKQAIIADAKMTTVAAAASKHGVSTFSIYKWLGVKRDPLINKQRIKIEKPWRTSFDSLAQIIALLPNLGEAEREYLAARLAGQGRSG